MEISVRFTSESGGILTIDGKEWSGPLPPNDGGLRSIYEQWLGQGNIPAPYTPPAPARLRAVPMWRARTIMRQTDFDGSTLFDAVTAAIAALPGPQRLPAEEVFERGDVFDMDGQFVPVLAFMLGIEEPAIESMIAQAAALPA